MDYFESENGMVHIIMFFIKTLLKNKERAITAENFNAYLDWSNQDF